MNSKGVVIHGKPLYRLLALLIAYKALFFVAAFVSMEVFPWFVDRGEYRWNRHWPLEGEATLASRFAAWDAAHYLYLAQNGYSKWDRACVFYPLWPGLIKAFSFLTNGDLFIAGIVLANLLSTIAFVLFHYFVHEHHDVKTADLATFFLLAFPGAIFFSLIYTESLFFLLVILFFIFLFKNNYWGVASTGFLLPLTKAVGIFCLVPLLLHLWSRRRLGWAFIAVAGPILGCGCYFTLMYLFTGNPWEGFEAQARFPNKASIANIFNLPEIIRAFFQVGSFHNAIDSSLDRILFVVFVSSMYWIYRLNKVYFAYALFVGAIPALSAWFYSYSRYIMMCFPVFIVLAHHLKGRKRRFIVWFLVAILGGVQVFCIARYVNFLWAG